MATALQCPDCGCKHRLDAVGDRAVFECTKCGRQLKVPQQYRPAAAPSKNGGATVPRAAEAAAPRRASRPRAKHRVGATPMRLPVRILLWVLAFVLGAVVVRTLAKWTGFAGGDTFFDLLIDGSFGTYLRLFALVPVWALFATIFATLMIDGPRIWASRRSGTSAPAVVRTPRPKPEPAPGAGAGVAAAAGAAAGAGAVRATQRSIPRREPKAAPRPEAPAPVAPPAAKTAVVPVAAATASEPVEDVVSDFAARAAAGQRPRRIPRRGAGS